MNSDVLGDVELLAVGRLTVESPIDMLWHGEIICASPCLSVRSLWFHPTEYPQR
jgi:hypothetical protein